MKHPKEFEIYIKKGIVKKISPDKSRANFLIREAENSMQGLNEIINKIGINKRNSNSIIKECYDIIMEKIRASMLLEGYCSSGNFAHEAEVSFMRYLKFSENEITFMNELRYFRNGAIYYGKILNKEYAKRVHDFLKRVFKKL